MGKHLVLVGGGHAHMFTLANLHTFVDKGHRVTVIGPSADHYYSGMGPGMLGGTYAPEEIRFATQHVVEKKGGVFVLGKAVRVQADQKTVILESGEAISYDVISFNAGSYVPRLNLSRQVEDIYTVKPIERLMQARKRILKMSVQQKISVGILGGGPSAAEIAGNVWQLVSEAGGQMPDIHIFAGRRFMGRFSEKVRKMVENTLVKRGVRILIDGYVQSIDGLRVEQDSGRTHDLDFLFLAMGVKPNPIFANSNLPTGPDGGLLVNAFLQCETHPDMFGGGDCICFQKQPLDKVGVYAVRQNPVLYRNLMARLQGKDLQAFEPGGDYLLIFNMGGGKGVLQKKWVTFGGRPAFLIKDYIDRKFMQKFQAIE
jgi:NADH dehydrogenase FAD-containing subunit